MVLSKRQKARIAQTEAAEAIIEEASVPRASEKTEKKAKDRPRPPGPACCGGHDDSDDEGYGARNMTGKPVSYWKGIKWTHVGFLLLLTGGTLLPAVLWVADNVALPSIPIVSTVAMTLGLGATPKLRLEKFYRKHNPEKVEDCDLVLKKYYGDYPALIRQLEGKYNDYGYFIGWEDDSSMKTIMNRDLKKAQRYFNKAYRAYLPLKLQVAGNRIGSTTRKLYRTVSSFVNGAEDPAVAKKRKGSSGGKSKRSSSGKRSGSKKKA